MSRSGEEWPETARGGPGLVVYSCLSARHAHLAASGWLAFMLEKPSTTAPRASRAHSPS